MSAPIIKTVNVNATIPIRNITPPMYGKYTNIRMTVSDILKCLCRRAIVEEVLSDGTTVRLNMKNFRDDHSSLVKNTEEQAELIPTCPLHPDGCIDHIDFLKDMDDDAEDDDQHEPAETDEGEDAITQADEMAEIAEIVERATSGFLTVSDSSTVDNDTVTITVSAGDPMTINLADETNEAKKKSTKSTSTKKSTKKSSKK